ncbi:unnamed protein product [Staurois parvus]|uniref:Secreted protein n=1 Tax=Staurois parvus TaxID=386267 RepID=A0ABN9F7G8_9NEOB|nr:unnamed protein product [Staurois parvus]
MPSGRLLPVARSPCPVVGCCLLCPRPLPSGRLPSVARVPCPVVGLPSNCCPSPPAQG